jgi:hypothetical protein
MAKDDDRLKDIGRTNKLRNALKFEKRYDLEDALKELIDEDCPGGHDIVQKYISTVNKHGYDSKEASDLYESIVKEHEILKDWLDIFYRLESGPEEA